MQGTLTVVFKFNDVETEKEMRGTFAKLFEQDHKSSPVAVTAISNKDEMTKLDLLEFYNEMGDVDLIRAVISDNKIEPYLKHFKAVQACAAKSDVSEYSVYENVPFPS